MIWDTNKVIAFALVIYVTLACIQAVPEGVLPAQYARYPIYIFLSIVGLYAFKQLYNRVGKTKWSDLRNPDSKSGLDKRIAKLESALKKKKKEVHG